MPASPRWLLAAALLLGSLPALAQTPAPTIPAGPPPIPRAWKTGEEAAAIERRIDALLAQMTLEEKVGQLNLWGRGDEFRLEWVEQGRTGAVMNFVSPMEVRAIQLRAARSRMRIPAIIALDAINGFAT